MAGSTKQTNGGGVEEVHILWISEGMSCDGDTVSITAATQPSIEDVLLGIIPGLPKVHLHNKVLAYETGGGVHARLPPRSARRTRSLRPRHRGVDSQRAINGEGYWTSFGNDPETGEPIRVNDVDRPARSRAPGRSWPSEPARLTAESTPWPAIRRAHGPGRLPRLGLPSAAGLADRQRPGLPGSTGQFHGDAALACSSSGGVRR